MYSFVFILFPQFAHIFERFAFCLGHNTPYEECGEHTYHTIESVGEPMTEIRIAGGLHVKHGYECGAYNPVEYPLESNGYGDRRAAYGVREYLGYQHPAYRHS